MNEWGKAIFIGGLMIAAFGLALWTGIGRTWIGRLPGDIHVSGEKYSFHLPIVTCLLASIVLSIVLWFLRKF